MPLIHDDPPCPWRFDPKTSPPPASRRFPRPDIWKSLETDNQQEVVSHALPTRCSHEGMKRSDSSFGSCHGGL